MLVALPLVFILLQAIFPILAPVRRGRLWRYPGAAGRSSAAGDARRYAVDRRRRGAGQRNDWPALGILRGMFSLPLPRLWISLFLIPSYAALYLGALPMLALQSCGYLQQLTGWQLNDLLFSRSGSCW